MSAVPGKPPRFGLDKTPPLQLEFIDHGDNNARKRVRSHAMKDVQRRKRWDYARSTDNKRRNEEKKRSAQTNTAIQLDPEKRPDINRQAPFVTSVPTKTSHQSDQSESDSYDAPPQGNSIQSQTRTSPLLFQNQYQSQTNCQGIQHGLPYKHSEEIPHGLHNHSKDSPNILPYKPAVPSPKSLPLRSNQQHAIVRSTRRGTPEEASEPSLADDESITGSESRRGYCNSQSPESDKWDDSQTKGTETQHFLVIADSDYEHGMSTDSDVEEMFSKGRQSFYDRSAHPAIVRVPNPKSLFSAARFDPFDTLAKKVKPEDRALVDHRIFVLPQLMFRVPSCCALGLVMVGPISFQASALAYSAAHLTRLQGHKNQNAIVHKSTALRQLHEGIQTISLVSCLDILYGILGLGMLEARFANKSNAWLHMKGALQVVEKFRDEPIINRNRDLNFWVPWILITIEGYDPFALHRTLHDYPYFYAKLDQPSTTQHPSQTQTQTPQNPSQILLSQSDPLNLTHAAVSEFLTFLRRIEHLSLTQKKLATKPPYPDWLFSVLNLPAGVREGVSGASIQTTSRLASLIYINAALWELQSSPQVTSQFIKTLKNQILDYKLGWTFSIEKLLHVMFETDNEHFMPGRSFFTARMANVAKRLNEHTWDRVNDFLMRCLRMRFQGNEDVDVAKDDSFLAWEDDLKRELCSKSIVAHEYYPGDH